MKIHLYTAYQEEGERLFNFIKIINLNFVPNKDFRYFNQEADKVYAFIVIYFTEEKISAIVSEQSESRAPIAAKIL